MRIEIVHSTTYAYTAPVRLDRQVVRLKPRTDAAQALEQFSLMVTPPTGKIAEALDEHGHWECAVSVEEPVDCFAFTTRSTVTTARLPPVPEDALPRLPWRDASALPPATAAWLQPREPDEAVGRFAADVAQGADWETVPFLEALALRIHRTHRYETRHEGAPWSPRETLASRVGACRDFAVLYVAACRAVGVPARFVSGYRLRDQDGRGRELHAWAEAALPGVGWRGFDPTIGRAVEEKHVAVAAGTVASSAPLAGTFWGPQGVSSRLDASVDAWASSR